MIIKESSQFLSQDTGRPLSGYFYGRYGHGAYMAEDWWQEQL